MHIPTIYSLMQVNNNGRYKAKIANGVFVAALLAIAVPASLYVTGEFIEKDATRKNPFEIACSYRNPSKIKVYELEKLYAAECKEI